MATRANDLFLGRDISRIVFRHKRKMLITFASTVGLVVLALIVAPRTYESDARLFVRMGKESVALDPTANLGQTVAMNESRESEINSELEILRSRVLLQDVVEELGADYVLRGPRGEGFSVVSALMAPLSLLQSALNSLSGISNEERAIWKLEHSIVAKPPKKSNVISIECRARRPGQAQKILEAFLDAYLTRHVKANRTSASYEFFVEQSKLLKDELQQAQEELRDAKDQGSLVSIDGKRQNLQTQIDSIDDARLVNARSLSAAEAKIAALQTTVHDTPGSLVAEEVSGLPNVAADYMRNELYKLEIAESDATSKYTEDHPQVKALRRQVAEMKGVMAQQDAQRSQATRKTNPTHQLLEVDLLSQQALAASLRAEAEALDRQYAEVQGKIQALNANEIRIAELNRRSELLEASYRDYVRNREQARVDQELETSRISNVNVLQPPSFIAKPASPSIRLSLALGLVVAVLAAFFVALLSEHFDRSLKTPEDVERELGIPVLVSVPRIVGRQMSLN